ncbi:MAG: hypothetical protein LBD77_07830 [Bifidobacteriaceae bacterium]|jgi:hypothetical protein|nr:hypothetical protein [Bifidobacteriaceae bacterium]
MVYAAGYTEAMKCSGWHTVNAIELLRARADEAVENISQAAQLVDLAWPDDWRSPAASAYGQSVARLRARFLLAAGAARDQRDQLAAWKRTALSVTSGP